MNEQKTDLFINTLNTPQKMKTVNPLTDSDKIDIALAQVFDLCIKSVPPEVWEAYKNNLYNGIPEHTEAVVKELQSKNFDASIIPVKGAYIKGDGIIVKIGSFKTCFTLESVPSLQKEYNSNLKRSANTFYDTNKGVDKTIKLYKNMGELKVKAADMALRFTSADEVKAEVLRVEGNIISANNDINITPKLATSKAKPGLLKVFTDELKYWQEVLEIAERTDYAQIALERECDNNEAIQALDTTFFQDEYGVYLYKLDLFKLFKYYDIKPTNSKEAVLQVYYADAIKEAGGNFNGFMQTLNDQANEYGREINEAYNSKGKLKNNSHTNRDRIHRKESSLEKTKNEIKFLAYNKSEIETLLQKHSQTV